MADSIMKEGVQYKEDYKFCRLPVILCLRNSVLLTIKPINKLLPDGVARQFTINNLTFGQTTTKEQGRS